MSDTAIYGKAAASLGEIPQGCQVLILSEDSAACNCAIEVCRRIMEQLGKDMEFDFRCWNFAELADPTCAHNAAKYAGVSEMILISTQSTVLPKVLNEWLDALHTTRFRAEGALVLILNKPASQLETDTLTQRLGKLAAQLAMNFVPLLPATDESAWRSQPSENWAMYLPRPDETDPPNPEHWGLNE